MSAYRLSGEAKVQGSLEFINHLLDNGVKFIVFGYHLNVLDTI